VESWSYFASVNVQLTDTLSFNVGSRWIEEEKDAFNSYFDYTDNTFDTLGPSQEFNFSGRPETAGTAYSASDDWTETISAASLTWAATDNMNLYAAYSEGFRSGGFSIRSARDPSEASFDPETAEQVELGIKSEWFGGRLRVNIAYFDLEVEGSQFSSIIPLPPGSIPGTTTLINNGAGSEIEGWEIETQWAITDYLTLIANGGKLDVTNTRFSIACELLDGCATGIPGVLDPAGTPRILGGNDDSRQPEWNANLSLAFGKELGEGFLSANVGWKMVGSFLLVNTGGGADQRLYEGGYKSVDARIAYDWFLDDDRSVTISVFGKNLTDEEWKEQALFLGGPATGFQGWGAPRTYALEVVYNH